MAAQNPISNFLWGPGGQRLTPEQVTVLRALQARKKAQGVDTSPVGSWTQGAARVLDALGDVVQERRLDAQDQKNKAEDEALFSPLSQAFSSSITGKPASLPMSGAGAEVSAAAPQYNDSPVTAAGEIADYIRQSATARGIDPDIALRVAQSEGGLENPVNQSNFVKNGVREESYGPFQLYLGGGLGNKALEAGIDPRDPNQWRQGVDFALDQAKAGGWGPWYGAKKLGITGMAGIGNAPATSVTSPAPPIVPVETAALDAPQTANDAITAAAPQSGYVDPKVTTAYQAPPPPVTAPQNLQQQAVQASPPAAQVSPQAIAAQVSPAAAPQMPQAPQIQTVAPQVLAQAIQASQSPYASDRTKAVANAIIQRQQAAHTAQQQQQNFIFEQQYKAAQEAADPLRQIQIQKAQQDVANGADRTPESVRALTERAQLSGLQPGTPEYNAFIQTGGNRAPPTISPPPVGYRYIYDANQNPVSLEVIPGSPQALEVAKAGERATKAQDAKDISSDLIIGSTDKALQAIDNAWLPTTGTLGKIASYAPESASADVVRQIAPLQATASFETLTQMRQASPTGGALGAVSDSEQKLLQAKAGALDPFSPNFKRDLLDYEKSVLRIVHGKEAGDAIFEQAQKARAENKNVIPTNIPGVKSIKQVN